MNNARASHRPVSIEDLKAGLAERIDALARELYSAGTIEGHQMRVGSVHGEEGRSMVIWLSGPKMGEYFDYAPWKGGDALDLVAHALFKGNMGEAVRWARSWLGYDALDPARLQVYRDQARKRKKESEDADERKRAWAGRMWFEAQPNIIGTPAAAYLRGRAIDLASLPRRLNSLRYHPALWNEESQRKHPALIAGIADTRLVAIHRTWLSVNADGTVTKAELKEPKMTLGRYSGASIRLWRGASAKAHVNMVPGEWLVISEGIEDGLSAVMSCPQYRTWAAVSLGNMSTIMLPAEAGGVIILAQNDTKPEPIAALQRAIENFQRQGKPVRIARVPEEFKDANDFLRWELSNG